MPKILQCLMNTAVTSKFKITQCLSSSQAFGTFLVFWHEVTPFLVIGIAQLLHGSVSLALVSVSKRSNIRRRVRSMRRKTNLRSDNRQ